MLAARIGADDVIVSNGDLARDLCEKLGSDGANVVIEATGAPALVVTALQLAAAGGRVILLGSTRGDTERVNFYRDVHKRGIHVIGAHESARPQHEDSPGYWTKRREQEVCLELLARGRVNVAPLISHRYDWRDFPKAYERLADWDQQALGM